MEKDWSQVGRSEQGASESSESKPESDKKKKRRRGEADSARARRIAAALESETKAKEPTEHRRARKALADILVEQGPAAESKSSERAKQKESGEQATSVETEKKPKTEDPEADRRESDVPQPERDRLRPGELYGGEFVLNLQDNKAPEEREIPLHETPAADATPAKKEREPEPEEEPVLRIAHEPQASMETPREEAEHEPAAEPAAEEEPVIEPVAPPVFQRQAEQPQQARAFEAPQPDGFVPTAPAPGPENPAGRVPEADPAAAVPVAPEGFEAVPVAAAARRIDPADVYPMYAQQPTARVANRGGSGEQMVTKQEADDAVYYATKGAQGRGVAAGFLLAALWARHRGKKLRRRFNEQFGKQEKEFKKSREEQRFYAAEQAQKQAETDRRLTAAEQRYMYAERQLTSSSQPNARFAAGSSPEGRFTANGQGETAPLSPEVIALMQKNQLAQQPGQPEQGVPEQLNVPPEHRLETSAWHTIEIDARTGRPVEQPTFAYGHEYYQERKHESAPASHRSSVAGEVALVGASVAGSQNGSGGTGGSPVGSSGTGGGSVLPSDIPNASMQGTPPGSPTAKARDAGKNITKTSSNGPIWPLVAALLIIFIVLIVLLH